MNPEDTKYPKSPHRYSPSDSSSSSSLMDFQHFPPTPLFVDDLSFSTSPLMDEFEAFSTISPTTTSHPISSTAGYEEEEVPRPLACLQEYPIPPFLSKTYDLVDDRSLDPIISWGSAGESFVVWDPVEFSRLILPRNFKHGNFSSFVRQLNTYGFRKTDTDRWEFANVSFRRGEKLLLKNIHRRKSPQPQQIWSHTGPSTVVERSGLENEVERLRKERSMMMQDVLQLQQEQHGTVHHVQTVNQRLQAAEQRQKQMVSFLAKWFQNPGFLARLKQTKEQGEIGSSRLRKKFVKHQQHEPSRSESSLEGQMIKYMPDWRNVTLSSVVPDTNPVPIDQSPDYVSQGMLGLENVASDELGISDKVGLGQGFIKTPEQVGEGTFSMQSQDLRGKSVRNPQNELGLESFVSFPQDFSLEQSFPELSPPCVGNIIKTEDVWNPAFDTSAGMSTSSNVSWDNLVRYDVPELGSTGSLSEIWDIGSVHAGEGLGIDRWLADENPVDESDGQAGQPKDDK